MFIISVSVSQELRCSLTGSPGSGSHTRLHLDTQLEKDSLPSLFVCLLVAHELLVSCRMGLSTEHLTIGQVALLALGILESIMSLPESQGVRLEPKLTRCPLFW